MDILNFSGPYAVGKDTAINGLVAAFPELHRVGTLTTRAVDKNADPSYTHLEPSVFERVTSSGNFIVNSQVGGTVQYATDLSEIREAASKGLLSIHSVFAGPDGAGKLKAAFGGRAMSIALVPPGGSIDEKMEVLRERIVSRGRDSDDVVRGRLARQHEILQYIEENPIVSSRGEAHRVFDRIMVSDDLGEMLNELKATVRDLLHGTS